MAGGQFEGHGAGAQLDLPHEQDRL